jgi:hypothetical protein
MGDSNPTPGAGPDPAPKGNTTQKVTVVAVITALAALVTALNKDALWKFVGDRIQSQQQAEANFNAELKNVVALLEATPPPPTETIRISVGTAYGYATKPELKCKVVNVIYNTRDQTLYAKIAPVEFLEDANGFKGKCQQQLKELAALFESKGGIVRSDSPATEASNAQSTRLHIASEKVLTNTTAVGAEGWAYLGKSDGHGNLTDPSTRSITQTRAAGRVTATQPLTLRSAPKPADSDTESMLVGRVPSGAVLEVGDVKEYAEPVRPGSPPAGYLGAHVKLVEKGAAAASQLTAPRRTLARAVRGGRAPVAALASDCPPFPQSNSLHGPRQRWVYVGQKADKSNNDAFIDGTSRLTTKCVPRDGAVARTTQQLKVLVGPDPHDPPGVRPNGDALTAGTSILVVGDVAGYGFDATADPKFCDRDPQPRRSDPPIPAGHEKRYCVYIPFNQV